MKQISNEEIYELRKSGMSYREMVKYFLKNDNAKLGYILIP